MSETLRASVKKILDGECEEDVKDWDALLDAAPRPDVYFRPAYARASATIENSKPVALVIEAGSSKFLFPALLRTVVNHDGSSFRDAASPYGYGGMAPLTAANPNKEETRAAIEALLQWCRDEQIVSYVVRMHPLLSAEELVVNLQDLQLRSIQCHRRTATVALDLRKWNDALDAPADLHTGKRSDLNHARRNLEVTWLPLQNSGGRSIFRSIYETTMTEVRADSFHRFPPEYYERLAPLGDKVEVAVAWQGTEPAGAAVFLCDRRYAHYHLSGTLKNGRIHKAATLILVCAAQRFRSRGCNLMHLGGGMTPNDSLMAFKAGFGGAKLEYQSFTLVPDPDRFRTVMAITTVWPYSTAASAGGEIL